MRYLVLGVLVMLLVSCSNNTTVPSELDSHAWLLGTWKGTNGEGENFYEYWIRENATMWKGGGFEINDDGDTTFAESLKIVKGYEDINYEVEFTDGTIKSFKLIEKEPKKLVFSLPENDFPSRMVYYSEDGSQLIIQLTGKSKKGTPLQQKFVLYKTLD